MIIIVGSEPELYSGWVGQSVSRSTCSTLVLGSLRLTPKYGIHPQELPSHLCVLLVSGEATPKQDERLHLLQKPLTTVIIARGNSSYRTNRTGVYIIEVVTQDFQGSIVLCQEQEVAILSV